MMHLVDKDSPYGSELSGRITVVTQEERLAWVRGYSSIHDDVSVNPYDPKCLKTGHLYYKYEKARKEALNDKENDEELSKDFLLRHFRNSF